MSCSKNLVGNKTVLVIRVHELEGSYVTWRSDKSVLAETQNIRYLICWRMVTTNLSTHVLYDSLAWMELRTAKSFNTIAIDVVNTNVYQCEIFC